MTDHPWDSDERAVAFVLGEMTEEEARAFQVEMQRDPALREAVEAQQRLDRHLDRHLQGLPSYRGPDPRPAMNSGRRTTAAHWLRFGLPAAIAAALLLGPFRPGGDAPEGGSTLWRVSDLDASLAGGLPRDPADSLLWLGFGTCSEEVVTVADGVYICALDRGSMLAEAGVEPGDTVIALDGRTLGGLGAYHEAFGEVERGASVDLTIRGAEGERIVRTFAEVRAFAGYPFDLDWSEALTRHTTTLRPGEISTTSLFEPAGPAVTTSDPVGSGEPRYRGMRVLRTVDVAEWERVRLLRHFPSPFVSGGLEVGDVILEYDGRPAAGFVPLLESLGRNREPGSTVSVLVERDGRRLRLDIPIR